MNMRKPDGVNKAPALVRPRRNTRATLLVCLPGTRGGSAARAAEPGRNLRRPAARSSRVSEQTASDTDAAACSGRWLRQEKWKVGTTAQQGHMNSKRTLLLVAGRQYHHDGSEHCNNAPHTRTAIQAPAHQPLRSCSPITIVALTSLRLSCKRERQDGE